MKNKLYERMNGFLKCVLHKMKKKYKNYKNLFKATQKKAKKIYYSNKLFLFTGYIYKTWNIMEDVIGKSKKN